MVWWRHVVYLIWWWHRWEREVMYLKDSQYVWKNRWYVFWQFDPRHVRLISIIDVDGTDHVTQGRCRGRGGGRGTGRGQGRGWRVSGDWESRPWTLGGTLDLIPTSHSIAAKIVTLVNGFILFLLQFTVYTQWSSIITTPFVCVFLEGALHELHITIVFISSILQPMRGKHQRRSTLHWFTSDGQMWRTYVISHSYPRAIVQM